MIIIEDIRQYLNIYAPKMRETTDSGESFYTFMSRMTYTGYQCLQEISIDEQIESASVRIYIAGYFKDYTPRQSDELINAFNSELRFASAYRSGKTLILENDVFLTSDETLPLIVDYMNFLLSHAKRLITHVAFGGNA